MHPRWPGAGPAPLHVLSDVIFLLSPYRSVLIVVPQIRRLDPGMMSFLGPFSLKRTVFFLRQQHFSLAGL